MGLGDRIKAAAQAMVFPKNTSSSWSYFLPRTRFDYLKATGGGRGNSIVMATILWLARNFPEATLRVWDDDGEGNLTKVSNHGSYPLLVRPNAFYSGTLLEMATIVDFVVTGNAYWRKIRSASTQVVELWWIPAYMMKPWWENDDEYVREYHYRPDTSMVDPIRLDPKDVVHFRYGLDPDNIRLGVSPLKSALREIFTDDEAANFSAALVRNVGVPGIVVVPGKGVVIDEEDAEGIKDATIRKFTGDRRGEPLILSQNGDVKRISFSPQEMDLSAMRRIPEERVTALTGVPAVVVGLGAGLDRSTYNNMAEARAIAYENGIIPLQRLLSEELTVQLLPDFAPPAGASNLLYGYDISKVRILQEDLNAQEQRLRGGAQVGLVVRREYREAMGLEVTDADDVYLMPSNLTEVPINAVPAVNDAVKAGTKGAKTDRHQRNLIRVLTRLSNEHADRFVNDLGDVFYHVADEVTARMRREAQAKVLVVANGRSKDGEDHTTEWPDAWLKVLDDPAAAYVYVDAASLVQAVHEAYTAFYTDVASTTLDATVAYMEANGVDVSASIGMNDPEMRRVVREGGTRAGLVDLPKQTVNAIYAALEQARGDNLGPYEALRTIKEYVEGRNLYPGIWDRRYQRELDGGATESQARTAATDAANTYRATVIARTETKYAQNKSMFASVRATDVTERLRVFDGDGCGWTGHDDPNKADGMIVTVDQAEDYPLAHPQCVRAFAPYLEEA